jgi:hypothetical protein
MEKQMHSATTTEIEPLLTPEEVSKATKIPTATLATWRSAGRGQGLPFMRMGGLVRYRHADVLNFINSSIHRGAKPDPTTVTLALHGNPRINYLAAQCAQTTLILHQKSAHIRFIHEAVLQAAQSGTAPEQYLRDKLAAIQSEIEVFDADVKTDTEHRKEESAKMQPFLLALMSFEHGLTSRRASLLGRIHGVDMQHEASIAEASKAGLTMAEMELLGRFEPPEISTAKWRAQIAEVDAQLAQIAAFSADPLKQLKHLAGLAVPGFEQQLAGLTS